MDKPLLFLNNNNNLNIDIILVGQQYHNEKYFKNYSFGTFFTI